MRRDVRGRIGPCLALPLLMLPVLALVSCHSGGTDGEAGRLSPEAPGTVPHVLAGSLPVPSWRTEDLTLRQSLDGRWRFLEDPLEEGETCGWHDPDHDRSSWRTIRVPGVWNAAFPELLEYEGVGWYATTFDVAGVPGGRTPPPMMLRFGSVFLRSRIYLNGVLLGRHQGGYTPIHLPTGNALRRTGNVLVVHADNRITWTTIPVDTLLHLGKHGWWPYGGISRSVTLHDLPDPWIFKLEPAFLSGDGDLEVTLGVWSRSRHDDLPLSWKVEGPSGGQVDGTVRLDVPGAGVNGYRFRVDTGRPAVWSRERPENLYRMTLVDDTGGDGLTVRFGHRTFDLEGDAMVLNGERDFWWGISRHSDHPDIGSVETDETIAREIESLRALHVNHIRPAHYPVDPRLLDALCDAGITVLEEVPVYQLFVAQMVDPLLIGQAKLQLAEMIERDKNNPAVLAWSVGNEYASYLAGAAILTGTLADQARALDPARPTASVITNVSCFVPIDFALPHVDIIGVNQYYGWYFGNLPGGARCLDTIHAMYPDKPIVATEFGAGAVAGWHMAGTPRPEPVGDHSYTEEWQAWYLEEQIEGLLARDYLSGVMPWALADFRMEWFPSTGKPHPVAGMNLKGLVTHDRRTRKLSFDVVADIYRARR